MYSYSELSNTVLRSIKEVLGLSVNPFLTDGLVSKLDADELDMIEIVMGVEDYLGIDWDICYARISELDLTVADLINDLAAKLKVPVGEIDSRPTFTQSELPYIEELEDRVEYLEVLCSDYAKIIDDKDKEIFQLKHQALRVANETVLGTTEEFKPISDLIIADWQQALDEGWEFETRRGDLVTVEEVDTDSESTYPITADGLRYTLTGTWTTNETDIDDIIKRTK